MKQIGWGITHLMISLALCTLAALGSGLFGGQWWMVFWVIVVAVLGFYRECVHDFGQHLRPGNYKARFLYSINPANISLAELKEDWPQAVTWPIGAIIVLAVFMT